MCEKKPNIVCILFLSTSALIVSIFISLSAQETTPTIIHGESPNIYISPRQSIQGQKPRARYVSNLNINPIQARNQNNSLVKPNLLTMDQISLNAINHFRYSNTTHINRENIKFYKSLPRTNKSAPDHIYRTFEDFNNEFLCPFDLSNMSNNINNANNKPNQTAAVQFIKDIFKVQFPTDCTLDNSKRYYIVRMPCQQIGLFATINCWSYYIGTALLNKRTLIFLDGWYSWATEKYCDNLLEECFFLPITNCSINDATRLINESKKIDSYFEWTREHSHHINTKLVPLYEKTKQVFFVDGWGYMSIYCDGRSTWPQKIKNVYGDGLSCSMFVNIIKSFIFRIQPSLLAVINNIVYHSYNSYAYDNAHVINPFKEFDPTKTISAMIRWGDKCYNSNSNTATEQECFTLDEYVSVTREMKLLLHDSIQNMIVTSESREIVQNITDNKIYDPVKDLQNVQILINQNDVMQGASKLVSYAKTQNVVSIMLSMLSTIKLQFGAKYYYVVPTSS